MNLRIVTKGTIEEVDRKIYAGLFPFWHLLFIFLIKIYYLSYPTHSPGGHTPTGFCGNTVVVELSYHSFESSDDLILLGEFMMASLECPYKVGMEVPVGFLIENSKSPSKPFNPLYSGLRVYAGPNETLRYEFNSEMHGWHYGWVANRRTKDYTHCFKVYVFHRHTDDTARCLGVFDGPEFSIHSRRRAKYDFFL